MDGEAPAVEPGPLEPAPGAKPIAQLGDVYVLGENRLICGDAMDPEVLRVLMQDEKARTILTDEPYNVAIATQSERKAVGISGKLC